MVVFEGIVRNHLGKRRTLYLEYEGYEPMAVGKMEEIGREDTGRFAIDRIGIIHRLGRIEIGETSVAIIVTSEHRRRRFRGLPFRDRPAETDRAHLEEGIFRGWRRLGGRRRQD